MVPGAPSSGWGLGTSLFPKHPFLLLRKKPPPNPRRVSIHLEANSTVHLPVEKSTLGPYLEMGWPRPLGCGWVLPRLCYFRLGGAAGSSRRGLPLGVFLEEQKGVQWACPIVDGSNLRTRTSGGRGTQGTPLAWERKGSLVRPLQTRFRDSLSQAGVGVTEGSPYCVVLSSDGGIHGWTDR